MASRNVNDAIRLLVGNPHVLERLRDSVGREMYVNEAIRLLVGNPHVLEHLHHRVQVILAKVNKAYELWL